MVFEAVEDVFEVLGVAGHIQGHRDDGHQMMDLRLLEFLGQSADA